MQRIRKRRSVEDLLKKKPKGDKGDNKLYKNSAMSGTLNDVVERIFHSIDELDTEIKGIKFPQGTRSNPARSCKDIFLGHPEFKDG